MLQEAYCRPMSTQIPYTRPYTHLHTHAHTHIYTHMSIHMPIHMSIHMSMHMSIQVRKLQDAYNQAENKVKMFDQQATPFLF